MNHYAQIQDKLKSFYRKYYKNQLIKGLLLFITFGVSYFLLTSLLEYSLWLSKTGRTVLFWLFVLVETYLLFWFIGKPLLKLFQAEKGITNEQQSLIVGKYFKEVEDKLLNVLQLRESKEQSDLLLASIEQKSKELVPIPFDRAINYKINVKYFKYAVTAVVLFLLLFFTNLVGDFSQSFERVMNYQTAYTPPAPFQFLLKNNDLNILQGEDYVVQAVTDGNIIPNEAMINFNGQEYFLRNKEVGVFEFTLSQVQENLSFFFEANGVQSQKYELNVLNTPKIRDITLHLNYPNYTGQKDKTIESPSNVIVPEGTKIKWTVSTKNTNKVDFIETNKRESFSNKEETFELSKTIRSNLRYRISTSNQNVEDYETLGFLVNVVRDELPRIEIQTNIDSVNRQPIYFAGQISDDYQIKKLQLVYQVPDKPQTKKIHKLPVTKDNLQSFYYDFPDGLELQEGVGYELFFEVYDNDAVNGSKKAQSKTFKYRVKTQKEIEEKILEDQKDYITQLEKSLLNQKQQKKDFQEIQNDLQNKQDMNWNDKKKIDNLIQRQKQYQQIMEKQTNNLLENLDEKKDENQELQNNKEELKKRIEELKKLKRQEKLLEELERLAKKLDKEELTRKTKELAEQNKQQERSLERILELTKRFYVEQKMTQVANKLNELSKEQDKLSQQENQTPLDQEKINKEFDKIEKELENLEKDNEDLKQPMDIPDVSDEQYEVNKEQQKAEKNLGQQNKSAAKKNQKKASKAMQKMSQKMMQTMMDMQANSIQENADDLRKILKNLITFSFKQESLMNKFSEIDFQHPDFGKNLKKQNELKTYFEHIDDSLYVLSMRVPQISSKLQTDLASAHYNLDESLENFSERRFSNGTSNQQYVMTSANNISDFLSDLLNNMNSSMSSSGKGKSSNSFKLPNLIQQQKGLSEQMKKGMSKQQKGNQKNGKEKGNKQGEENNGDLYRIFQQQSQLKDQLQDLLKEGNDSKDQGNKVVKFMEQLENEILEKGFTNDVLQRMQNLEYELLKLEKAALEQNKDKKRKSNTNKSQYNKSKLKEIETKKLFYKQLEILNRQSLPLQQNYKKKVQKYFSKTI